MKPFSLKNALKWLWVVLVLSFIGIYAAQKKDIFYATWEMLHWEHLALSILAIIIAKFSLTANMHIAAIQSGIFIRFIDSFRIYNLSQLAKYIPGSVWQFVSRAAMLHKHGATPRSIRDSMLAEHAWALGTASVFGVLLLTLTAPSSFFSLVKREVDFSVFFFSATIALALVAILAYISRNRIWALGRWLYGMRPSKGAIGNLLCCWCAMGTSLWITTAPLQEAQPGLLFVIGLYSAAYVAGFLVPFAPAGLGVREAILVAGLSPLTGIDVALVLSASHRLIYLVSEFLLGFIGYAFPNRDVKNY